MFCMSLSNGAFSLQDFSTNNANIGQVTITRMPPPGPSNPSGPPSSIVVTHSSFPNPLVINGSSSKDFKSILYGSGNKQYVAILTLDSFTGAITRTVTIVDFCSGGSTPGQNLIHTQTPISNGTDTPVLFTSPGTQDVILVYSPTGTANEFQNLAFHRSATGGVLIDGPGTLSNSSAAPSASVTATELVMNHPNTGGAANSTSTPRPAGLSTITDPPNFGEVVIGASDPALGTSTKVASIKNDGNDCLTITAIGNVAPFTVRPATLAQLPKTLQPGQSFDVDIDFTPTAVGSNIQQNLPVTLSPNNGASQIQCKGSARAAVEKTAAPFAGHLCAKLERA